jgi:lipid-binding SYLF domain-containing protein
MKKKKIFPILLALCSFFLLTGFFGEDQTPEEERKEILKMRQVTLNDLYKELPGAKKAIEDSTGYAVFDNVGINLFAVSTGNGSGVAHDKETGKDTFMKMFSAGVGIGLGIKDFRGVFVFSTKETFDNFVNTGWQAGAQADAAAKSDDKGDAMAGAIDVGPGIKLYQLTETGLALQATIQGTKYWKNDDLNE